MITPGYAVTASERILPKFALNFTTASLDSRVTFARSGNTATVVNSSGNIATINADLPRFDFNATTLACRGLLIEESRQNGLLYSEDFSNAAWSYSNSSFASGVSSPSGGTNAYKLVENSSNSTHSVVQFTTPSRAAGTYTFSIYAQAAGRTQLRILQSATTNYGVLFDLSAVTATSEFGGATGTITAFRSGWYRLTMTFTTTVNIIFRYNLFLMSGGVNFYQGNGTSGVNIYGGQIEAGAFATSYIPTTNAAVTRDPDIATITGTNFSSWWTATTGAAAVNYIPMSIAGTRPALRFDDNTADNIISLRGNAADPELYIRATTDQAQIDAGTLVANSATGLAGAWNTDNAAASANGAAAGTDTSVTVPTVTQARIGTDGTNYLNGWVQGVRYWPQRITDAEVQAFSK